MNIFTNLEETQINFLGENHETSLKIQCSKAKCLKKLSRFDEAYQIYLKWENVYIETYDESHSKFLKNRFDMAICLQQMRKLQEAYDMLQKNETVETEVLGQYITRKLWKLFLTKLYVLKN